MSGLDVDTRSDIYSLGVMLKVWSGSSSLSRLDHLATHEQVGSGAGNAKVPRLPEEVLHAAIQQHLGPGTLARHELTLTRN